MSISTRISVDTINPVDMLNSLDSIILFRDVIQHEAIQHLRYLLVSLSDAGSGRDTPLPSSPAAEFVAEVIHALEPIPISPRLSPWQNLLVSCVLSSEGMKELDRGTLLSRSTLHRSAIDNDLRCISFLLRNVPECLFDHWPLTRIVFEPLDVKRGASDGLADLNPVARLRHELTDRLASAVIRRGGEPDIEHEVGQILREGVKALGYGPFAVSHALQLDGSGELRPVQNPDSITLDDLALYDRQKFELLENTKRLIAGLPAHNVLLYGDRGTGKSSLVKATARELAPAGLRLVEVQKAQLTGLGPLMRTLRQVPLYFIVFVDDLSFEDGEPAYKPLKAVLEGSVEDRPDNVIIYATSNRRHIVAERFSDSGDDARSRDTLEEKLSLSDRFGITLLFPAPDQEGYLRIVNHIAAREGVGLTEDELRRASLRWALQHNGRSGRTARQFVDDALAHSKIDGQAGRGCSRSGS